MALKHEMQHDSGPTWCVHCGTFSCYCKPGGTCDGSKGKYDTRNPERLAAVTEEMFGAPAKEVLSRIFLGNQPT